MEGEMVLDDQVLVEPQILTEMISKTAHIDIIFLRLIMETKLISIRFHVPLLRREKHYHVKMRKTKLFRNNRLVKQRNSLRSTRRDYSDQELYCYHFD